MWVVAAHGRYPVPPSLRPTPRSTPEGAAARQRVGEEAYALNVQQFCCAGLNFGYFYSGSPLIVDDGEAAPAYTMGSFTESTVPGCRVPHVWLADGRSLFDAFGPGYTLLRRDARVDVAPLLAAAARRGVPLQVLDAAPRDGWPEAYRHALVLCRADTHVVWRGDQLPEDALALVDRLRGVPADDLRGAQSSEPHGAQHAAVLP